ncbi:MAG: aminoacyl-tRNA deacylase [Polyangiaceae bacterium]
MKPANVPSTPAILLLKKEKVAFETHFYRYEERGGTAASARELGVDEHAVVKTLIFETDAKSPVVVLMHGDREVSAKELARVLGVKSTAPCKPDVADRHSGYHVGGTSPFGTRKTMPIVLERTITELPRLYVNGGAKGFLVSMAPAELVRVLAPRLAEVATPA